MAAFRLSPHTLSSVALCLLVDGFFDRNEMGPHHSNCVPLILIYISSFENSAQFLIPFLIDCFPV